MLKHLSKKEKRALKAQKNGEFLKNKMKIDNELDFFKLGEKCQKDKPLKEKGAK